MYFLIYKNVLFNFAIIVREKKYAQNTKFDWKILMEKGSLCNGH